MTTHVRTATPADVPALAALAARTFPLACPPGSTAADQSAFIDAHLSPDRFAGYVSDAGRVVLVASDGRPELIGYTMLVAGEPADLEVQAALRVRPTIELSKCYVDAGHHGAGVSHALMSASLDAARATGAAAVWLGVNQLNARAQAFYVRNGFERVGVKHFVVGTRVEDDFVYERAL
jgi:diamine N-acetyltransferase